MLLKNTKKYCTKDKLKTLISKNYCYFILGSLIGLLCFLTIYGFNVLKFTNDQWLYNSGDLTQHYIGWNFFRNSPWTFPLGMSSNYAYPFGVAITYTDSIPLFAIFFKILSPILPKTFQYFGLFQLISFMLQGGFTAIILKKYMKNFYLISLSSVILVLSPIILRRVFIHTALSAQWIILFAMSIWVYKENFKSLKSKIFIWALINSLAILIHPYFIPMTGIFMVATLLSEKLNLKTIKETIIVIATSILSVIVIFWAIGGFTGDSLEAAGLGRFSMNLNSFFDSNGWSIFLKDLPTVFFEQYEGFQYLGLGVILLIPFALFFIVKNIITKKIKIDSFKNFHCLLIVVLPLTILSLSTTIAFNEKVLFSYELPKKIQSILSIFRSTGRLFWPITYMVIFFLIVYIFKNMKKKKLFALLLTAITLIQVIDLSSVLIEKQKNYKPVGYFNSILTSNLWNDIGKKFKHIMIVPAYDSTYSFFSKLANEHDMTLNIGSFARAPYEDINNLARETEENLIKGNYLSDTIYIIQKFGLVKEILTNDTEGNFIAIKVENTDNCFALIPKNTSIDFSKYPENPTYSFEDFKELSLDEYLDYISNLSHNAVSLISTKGNIKDFITEDLINKFNNVGLLKDFKNFKDENSLAYAALKINGSTGILEEILSPELAIIDVPKGREFNEFKTERVLNINGSANEENNYSIMLLDGFQHSFDEYGINFLIYDLKENKVLDSSIYNPTTGKITSMRWK